VHRGFGAGAGEADEVEARDGLAEEIGKLLRVARFRKSRERRDSWPLARLLEYPSRHDDQRGPVTATQVDVFAPSRSRSGSRQRGLK